MLFTPLKWPQRCLFSERQDRHQGSFPGSGTEEGIDGILFSTCPSGGLVIPSNLPFNTLKEKAINILIKRSINILKWIQQKRHKCLSVECPPKFYVLFSMSPTEVEGYMRKCGLVRGLHIFVMSLDGSGRPGSNLFLNKMVLRTAKALKPDWPPTAWVSSASPSWFCFYFVWFVIVFLQCSYLPNNIGGSPKYLLSMALSFGYQISKSWWFYGFRKSSVESLNSTQENTHKKKNQGNVKFKILL